MTTVTYNTFCEGMKIIKFIATVLCLFVLAHSYAEDGSRLWLPSEKNAQAKVTANSKSPTIDRAIKELQTQWKGAPVRLLSKVKADNTAVDGYIISGSQSKGVTIRSKSDIGILYGAFHLLRLQQTGNDGGKLFAQESPAFDLRILNHWDNIDGSIERGYAGNSLWDWADLPEKLSPRYTEYARANASIGINATVLNNVNANPKFISKEYLLKAAALAEVFRPWGIKVYLSVNFSSPAELGGLPTSDPLDPVVRQWWKDKVREIYSIIPGFGGFLVKANSEGLPGPQDFGRTHADGANMLAEALEPFEGIVLWRAFVYDAQSPDRAKQAYEEFKPLDGQFHKNVIIQVKNGPIDFQPREPFNPLFGAMQKTPLMLELQITQEYLGQSKQLAYLAPMYEECLQSDTYAAGRGSTVAKIITGKVFPQKITAIAGVANTGKDANWTGHLFAQSNWYCFGRLAWNPQLSSEQIADEWLKMTFTSNPAFVEPVKQMMLESREAMVNYMMPLGLAHLFAWAHHYGPDPGFTLPGARPDWLPPYYHHADSIGLGFDRTTAGSNAVSQYFPPLRDSLNNLETCPEKFLLWFHHVPWDYRMQSRRTLWEELCYKYRSGVDSCFAFQKQWEEMKPYIDKERFEAVAAKLKIQVADAIVWRDVCLGYFQIFSKMDIE
ncbi:xylan alpha-1,2-glucuronidase [Bacteroidia bacterium]|nr:xylan alpha-1,2-glucuronidase [Bacteroidia bacterium]GHT63554.1 xylan alpha-1,2-glucuronidase [Bacteroidia bacterium]